MKTNKLLEIIKNGQLDVDMVLTSDMLILAKFTNSRKTMLDIYQVRNDMFSDLEYRNHSKDSNIYEGLVNVVNKMNESNSDDILFIEVKTQDGDEISLFFQANDNLFLGYIYIPY